MDVLTDLRAGAVIKGSILSGAWVKFAVAVWIEVLVGGFAEVITRVMSKIDVNILTGMRVNVLAAVVTALGSTMSA